MSPGGPSRPDGSIPSPNIWGNPDLYEIENEAVDPDGLILDAIRAIHPPAGSRIVDVGCGSGFHLPLLAGLAGPDGQVTGVEPHPPLQELARRRIAGLGMSPGPAPGLASDLTPGLAPIQLLAGTAQQLPLPDDSVDLVHARWAYFFGPGCEPGLAELARVLRPGGTAFVIDNDATTSTFGRWFRREHPSYDPMAIERFWRRRGYEAVRIPMRWRMRNRADFEAVVRIEFSPRIAQAFLDEHDGCEVDYAVNLWWSRY